jgi:hypothetical protein
LSFNVFFWLGAAQQFCLRLAGRLAMLVKAHGDQFLLTNSSSPPGSWEDVLPGGRPTWVQKVCTSSPSPMRPKHPRGVLHGPRLEPYAIMAVLG